MSALKPYSLILFLRRPNFFLLNLSIPILNDEKEKEGEKNDTKTIYSTFTPLLIL